MKTTELFAEQVLIGLVVILLVGLVVYDPANPIVTTDNKNSLELIVTGGLLLGGAYLIGMVYDRLSDTLLQDLESHCRLHFVSEMNSDELKKSLESGQDPFEEGRYRVVVLGNSQATDHMEYLRSRIRLTRALATLLPGIIVSILLAMDYGKASSWWKEVAVIIPIAYGLAFLLKMKKRPTRPPKTYKTAELKTYLDRAKSLPNSSNPLKRAPLYFLLRDEVWIALSLLAVAATILILSTRSYARFSVLLVGLVLTIIVGWSWWRISLTFYSFLRDYEKFGACKPGCAPETEAQD